MSLMKEKTDCNWEKKKKKSILRKRAIGKTRLKSYV